MGTLGQHCRLSGRFGYLTGLALAWLTLGAAPQAPAAPLFYPHAPEGYFWYRVPLPPPKKHPRQPRPLPPIIEPHPESSQSLASPPAASPGPVVFSARWIRQNLPKYRDRAIDHPSRDNVLAYMYLQRVMMDKSERFSDAVQAAVKTTPGLDEGNRRPLNGLGATLADQRARRNRSAVMRSLAKRIGLWFFYSPHCPACVSEAAILGDLHELYGVAVTPIARQGAGAPPPPFTVHKTDQGQAKRLSITAPMALYLVNPATQQVVAIAQGLLSRSQMLSRLLLAAHTAGWLSDRNYQRTRPMRTDSVLTADLGAGDEKSTNTADAVPLSPHAVLRRLGVSALATRLKE